ncbi:MAG: Forkhead-associated protein [Schlesneria sp.]|nr:Forkhead-associated protein [Schlesneria sp.]
MLQAELKILGGKHQGKTIPLSTKKFLVGREQDCQLRPNSDLVSRHHCVFTVDDYAVRLRDLGSTNGTRVNGKPLHGELTLNSGDQIGIGKLELELVIRQRAVAEVPVAEPEAPAPLMGLSSSELDVTPASATIELPSMDNLPASNDTSFELPTSFAMPTTDTSTSLTADTTIIPGAAPPAGYPGYAPMPPAGYPGMAPAYPGYAPQQMGYPQQQMGYPQQQMGYPQQQMGYPQYPAGYGQPSYPGAMPGYPMQQYPQGQMPQQATAAPASDSAIAVKLPSPESTGVKAPPPPAAPDPAGGPPKTEEKPSNTAADIIKNYMQKRTR